VSIYSRQGAYRIGLDLGTNSLGWCLLDEDEAGNVTGIRDIGVRIFADGRDAKSGASLAIDRRLARSASRRRDRYLRRRTVLMEELVAFGLMPEDLEDRKALETLDPYALRAEGLDHALPLYHFGRAIFHLNQRRGFKSNRKADRNADDDQGKIAQGIDRLKEKIRKAKARTYGEYLHKRREAEKNARRVPTVRARIGDDNTYSEYPERLLFEEEFDRLWEAQARFHPSELTEATRDRLRQVIFYQRPLKAPKIGRCTFFDEPRLPKAHPFFQERRLLEEVNALEVILPGEKARKLTAAERDDILLHLQKQKTMSFSKVRTRLKCPDGSRFNKETPQRTKLLGDEVRAVMSDKSRFGPFWLELPVERQIEVLSKLRTEEDEDKLAAWLQEEHGLSDEQAVAVSSAHLPEGYGRLGETATGALIEELKAQDVPVYSEAVKRAGERYPEMKHHSDFRDGEVWEKLPYYGQILARHIPPGTHDPKHKDDLAKYHGRITNPTVHIGLNQIRKVVNDLIEKHGHPMRIVVELARDLKLNDEQKRDVNKAIKENTEAAEKRSKKLDELGQADTGANRALLKQWEELSKDPLGPRNCPYCGVPIGVEELFSSAVDIDHILPYSRTLDDSPANKVVCHRACNRKKRNQSPYEAFSRDEALWATIQEQVARLPHNKQWRFGPDAMEKYENEERDFLARQLVDTQYLSRLAAMYLQAICPNGDGGGVYVTPGRMTEMLRRKWGLNSLLPDHNLPLSGNKKKNRLDHQHHAIDAFVVGVTDRSLLNSISRAAGKAEKDDLDHVLSEVQPPFGKDIDDMRRALGDALEKTVVSHKTDHGKPKPGDSSVTAGKLHNDTAYGLTGEVDEKGNEIVVVRKGLTTLKSRKELGRVRDETLRNTLLADTEGKNGKEFTAALEDFARAETIDGKPNPWQGLRHVRMTEPLKTIKIKDKSGRAYKGYKGDSNLRYDVWELPNGKWAVDVVSMFEAHQPSAEPQMKRDHPTAKKVMRLFKNDTLALEDDNGRTALMRIVKFAASGQMLLAPHNEAGALKTRDADKEDPFKYISVAPGSLKRRNARKVRIDSVGHVFDPGPRSLPA
jgi:CRISPR-associated endonuclease Csn1